MGVCLQLPKPTLHGSPLWDEQPPCLWECVIATEVPGSSHGFADGEQTSLNTKHAHMHRVVRLSQAKALDPEVLTWDPETWMENIPTHSHLSLR